MSFASQGRSGTLAVTLIAAIAISGCASAPVPHREHDADALRFDPDAVAWSKKSGTNAILGTAELTTEIGQNKTCAGLEVRLVPDAHYTRERVAMLYGTTSEGFVEASEARRIQQTSDAVVDPAYANSHKVAMCDRKGRFAFAKLADGTYYVLAPVIWQKSSATSTHGGFLMQRVTVSGGETRRLHMTPESRISSR